MIKQVVLGSALLVIFVGCGGKKDVAKPVVDEVKSVSDSVIQVSDVNYYDLKSVTDSGFVNVVIEIPAGTNHKVEYNSADNSFPCDQENGSDRVVSFLPYPGNYGFVPSTMMDKERGGDGDALDVLVLGESVPTASVLEVKVIGVLQLLDRGEKDDKIIAVLAKAGDRILDVADYKELPPAVLRMIEMWFENYKGAGKMELVGWQDADQALEMVSFWRK